MEGDVDADEEGGYRLNGGPDKERDDAEAVARGPKLSVVCISFFSGPPVLVVSSRGRFGVRGMVPVLYAVTNETGAGAECPLSLESYLEDGFGRE